jgi:two-component system chemotaxis response regulator CheY
MRILLVEDDEVAMFILQRMIGKLGHTAVCCFDGEQALKMLDGPVDLVITDWMLPNMTGLELIEKINTSIKKLPILLVSGMPDKILQEKARIAGVKGILSKPYTIESLRIKIDELG